MNWSLINNYHFSFFKLYSCNNNSVLFIWHKRRKRHHFFDRLDLWQRQICHFRWSMPISDELRYSNNQTNTISHTLTTNRKTSANICNWICVRGIFTTRFHKQWNKKAIYYLRNFVFNLRLYWSTWSGALGKNTEKYSYFKA